MTASRGPNTNQRTGADSDHEPAWETGGEPAWKIELQQKLAASRARRGGSADGPTSAHGDRSARATPANEAARSPHGVGVGRASLAATVAARYSSLPSYREALAQQAHAAAEAAEEAALHAHAAAEAVLAQMEESRAMERVEREARDAEEHALRQAAEQPAMKLALDGRTQHHLDQHRAAREAGPSARPAANDGTVFTPSMPRLTDPIEEVLVTPSVPLAANLIEFPRELVAVRKARPRLAEGPLREASGEQGEDGSQDASQLRIFEVNPWEVQPPEARSEEMQAERASARTQSRAGHPRAGASEWSAIRLDSGQPGREQPHLPRKTLAAPLKTASIQDRLMSALVDSALVSAGFLLFVLVFCACTAHPPTGKAALAGSAAVLLGFAVVYQLLFFTFGETTPGMSYAHIALCTFDDSNPSRKAMRRRVGALLLSALPVGLGLLWAVFDEDRLGWHDRISGMYQRSYR